MSNYKLIDIYVMYKHRKYKGISIQNILNLRKLNPFKL